MAIEIAFCVCGKETKQAFFVEEAELNFPLTKVRTLVEKQKLHLPKEYAFLTRNGNAIANPAEEHIILRDIIQNSRKSWNKKEMQFDNFDFETKKEINSDEVDEKPVINNSQVWIAPLKVIEAETNVHNNPMPMGADEDTTEQTHSTRESNGRQNQQLSFCPFANLKRVFCKQDGSIDVSKILKTLIPLAVFLFIMLAILTFSLHVFVKSLMLKTGPNVLQMLHTMDEGGFGGFAEMMGAKSGQSSDITDLKIKLSQLEIAHKFQIEQLTNRITELEDLYLKDLDYHKRELNAIKRRMADQGNGKTILNDEVDASNDIEEEEEDENVHRLVKEGKRKYTAQDAGRTRG